MDNSLKNISWPGWETVGLIGRGRFGAVYEIERQVLGNTEKAALKVISIPPNASDIDEMYNDGYDDESISNTISSHLQNIIEEYSLMKKLSDCANVVNCDDIKYTQHEEGIGWDIFIKMELLTPLGKSISETVTEKDVIQLGKDMCNALIYCKKENIVHRDIKPQNIFVSKNGVYKLGDFGIAKTIEKTMGGTMIGTYKYMAPEVYNNKPYGSSADIYSLGLVLYWVLNNRHMPFISASEKNLTGGMEEEAKMRRFSGEKLPEPFMGSPHMKKVVLKACEFEPEDRYTSAEEMYKALCDVERGVESKGDVPEREQVRVDIQVTQEELAKGCRKIVNINGEKIDFSIPKAMRDGEQLFLKEITTVDTSTGKKKTITPFIVLKIIKPTSNGEQNDKQEIDFTLYLTKDEIAKGVYQSKIHNFQTKFSVNVKSGSKIEIVYKNKTYIVTLEITDDKTKDYPRMSDSKVKKWADTKPAGCISSFLVALVFIGGGSALGMAIPIIGFPLIIFGVFCFLAPFLPPSEQDIEQAKKEVARRQKEFKKAVIEYELE